MATVVIKKATRRGDLVTITGTVDGAEVTVDVWDSHLQTLPNRQAKVQFVAQQLKAQVDAKVDVDLAATVNI